MALLYKGTGGGRINLFYQASAPFVTLEIHSDKLIFKMALLSELEIPLADIEYARTAIVSAVKIKIKPSTKVRFKFMKFWIVRPSWLIFSSFDSNLEILDILKKACAVNSNPLP